MLDVDDAAPTPARMLVRGLTRRCPLCGARHLFHRWLAMEERCPGCGHLFQRRLEDGFFLGAYMMNLTFTFVTLAVVLFLDVAREAKFVHLPFWAIPALGLLSAIGVPLVGYPFSKTTWSAIDLAMHPPDIVERADAAAHHQD